MIAENIFGEYNSTRNPKYKGEKRMNTIAKRLSAAAAALVIAAGSVYTGICLTENGKVSAAADQKASETAYSGKKPKYIFMFIGDGMSYPQIQVTQDYYSAIRDTNNNDILEANSFLNFTHFDAAGSAITYDSTSFCPDSASPAAYYAHQASRNSYYEIGLEMIGSDFDYFAGGGLKQVSGKNGDRANLYDLAA